MTEEERPHAHLIGSTQEGKSKFIEHLVREDVRRGFGACVLDPTTGAKTIYDILRWCCDKKVKKVCLIDPHARWEYNKIVGINPFLYKKDGPSDKLKKASLINITDTIQILFNTKDPAQTSFINRYVEAVLNCLYNASAPLSDARCFTNQAYVNQRKEVLSASKPTDPHRIDLEEAFRNAKQFEHLQTTINRLQGFFRDPLSAMLGVSQGVDFLQMVKEGWLILVNLDSSVDLDVMDARLLGTLIINQLLLAMDRLFYLKKNKATRFYLYVDEAGEYATRKLARAFTLKAKTGLRVTIGHQYFGQFEDKYVVDAINALTKMKGMFNLPGREDRDKVTKMFYGGDISDRQASFANADLPQQHAVLKILKGGPQRVRIPDVPPARSSDADLREYIARIFDQPWYYNPRDVKQAHDIRYLQTDSSRTPSRKEHDREADSETSVPAGLRRRRQQNLSTSNEEPQKAGERRPIKV